MLAEVEKSNIGTIIVKDMSRLGRNYVQMGMLREQTKQPTVAERKRYRTHSKGKEEMTL